MDLFSVTIFAVILVLPIPLLADQDDPGSAITLDSAIALAVRENPDLAQMHARSEAFAAIPSQVGTLPDPRTPLFICRGK